MIHFFQQHSYFFRAKRAMNTFMGIRLRPELYFLSIDVHTQAKVNFVIIRLAKVVFDPWTDIPTKCEWHCSTVISLSLK